MMDVLLLVVVLSFSCLLLAGAAAMYFMARRMQEHNRLQFENLAHRIFDESNKSFLQASQSGLAQTLAPVKEKLGEVQEKFDRALKDQIRDQASLKKEIQLIAATNQVMSKQAKDLTIALRGDVRVQGNWGEIILERILQNSGLREGEDYAAQKSVAGEDGQRLRPDVLVYLPQNRHLIIDAKVSLTHYERLAAAPPEEKPALVQEFLHSVRHHVRGLADKAYHEAEALDAPDFVLMFLPIEGAYMLAMQQDKDLQTFAWEKKVVITCPATLFASLRVIAQFWREDRQNRNVMEIARQGGQLYDKIAAFVEDMERVGKQLDAAQTAYEQARNKLHTGRGNVLSRTERLRELGAKTSKSLPQNEAAPDEEKTAEENPAPLAK